LQPQGEGLANALAADAGARQWAVSGVQHGVGVDDDEIRTGNAMIIDPDGRILSETWKAGDDMVIADLDASLLDLCTGRRWIQARRPELYGLLTVPTGIEQDARTARFGKK